MIVWGSGAEWSRRYNPVSDSWTPMSAVGAPYSGVWSTVVWTGTEMIVWGGLVNDSVNTGGRYNPASDTWTATSTLGAPLGRFGHSAVWTGSRMIVWGGVFQDGNIYLGDGGAYDPETDTWAPISGAGAPSPRARHTALWTGNLMLVWGGDHYGNH